MKLLVRLYGKKHDNFMSCFFLQNGSFAKGFDVLGENLLH